MPRKQKPSIEKDHTPDIVIITGLSGSGMSSATNAFQDLGYFCVDNLPTTMLQPFAGLVSTDDDEKGISRAALVIDIREGSFLDDFEKQLSALRSSGLNVTVLFFEASDDVLQHRFSETLKDESPLVAQSSARRILATLWHLALRPAKTACECPGRADPPWHVEKDDGLRAFEGKVERLVVVAVGDPGFACEETVLLLAPLALRRLHPARLPVVDVEMNHSQSRPGRERPRERALPGSGHAGDDHPSANRLNAHRAKIPLAARTAATTARGSRAGKEGSSASRQDGWSGDQIGRAHV